MKLMKVSFFVLLLSIAFKLSAQLAPGHIAFIGVQSDNYVAFAVMVINPIPPNTEIRFTDNGWSGSAFSVNENIIRYTSPNTTLQTGHVLRFLDTGGPAMTVIGGGSCIGKINVLSQLGDQILAYTGTNQNPSFIAGISTSNWLATCDTTLTNPLATCLPAPLENGVNAIALSGSTSNFDNAFWNVETFNGSPEELLAAINNVSNWIKSESPNVAGYSLWPNWGQGSTTNVPSAVSFSQTTLEITEGAPSANVTLTLQFPQATQQTITLNVNLFPGTTLDDFSTTPALNSSNQLVLNVPQGATEVNFQIQAPIDGIIEDTEFVSFSIASLSAGLSIGNPSTVGVSILNIDNSTTSINFLSDTLTITEGQVSLSQVLMSVLPTLNQSGTITIGVQNGTGVTAFDYFTQPALQQGAITLTLPANSEQSQFAIAPFNDTEIEPDEFIIFTLNSASAGYAIGPFNTLVVKIVDNDTPPPVIIPTLVINEISAANTQFGNDENGEFDDWIELFNQEDYDVNIASYYITNDANNPQKFRFPTAFGPLTIPAQGYKLIWCDNFTAQGPLHTNFTLANNGGFIRLTFSNGSTLLDSTGYPEMTSLQTYARIPNGSGPFKLVLSPSPAKTNIDTIPFDVSIQNPIIADSGISIYPNPTSDFADVSVDNTSIKSVQLIDLQGRIVNTTILSAELQNTVRIQTESLPNGIYIVQVRIKNNEVRNTRLVLNR